MLLCLQDDLVINGIKYHVKVVRRGPILFNVSLNKSNVDVLARKLGDGGFLLQVCVHVECTAHHSQLHHHLRPKYAGVLHTSLPAA